MCPPTPQFAPPHPIHRAPVPLLVAMAMGIFGEGVAPDWLPGRAAGLVLARGREEPGIALWVLGAVDLKQQRSGGGRSVGGGVPGMQLAQPPSQGESEARGGLGCR